MIDAKQIPADVWNAYLRAWEEGKAPAVCLVTALNAWPGVWTSESVGNGSLILPLPQEPRT